MKSKIFNSNNLNNIIFIVLLLVIILIICYKSITIHSSIMEQFEDGNQPASSNNAGNNTGNNLNNAGNNLGNNAGNNLNNTGNNLGNNAGNNLNNTGNNLGNNEGNNTGNNLDNNSGNNAGNNSANNQGDEDIDNALVDVLSSIGGDNTNNNNNNVDEDSELEEKCNKIENKGFGSITSKYSGKSINVEALPPVRGSKRKYMIQWQPVGGKPGGCITANADGTYSTPICNANINKQQWFIKEVKDEDEYLNLIPRDRQSMGRSMDETEFPFHIVQSTEFENYCLHYEGGGLAIREIANYDSQKWDVSKDKIYQEPLPTQGNNKFTGLTPGHKMTNSDKSLGSVGENGGKGEGESNPMQFNINVDPDLLSRLGIKTGLEGLNSAGSNSNNSNGVGNGGVETHNSNINSKRNGLLISQEQLEENRKNGDVSDMLLSSGDNELCDNCGKIPDNMIRKDLVKSMCIGCNNIDNILE